MGAPVVLEEDISQYTIFKSDVSSYWSHGGKKFMKI
jgi:hypothetical protein